MYSYGVVVCVANVLLMRFQYVAYAGTSSVMCLYVWYDVVVCVPNVLLM